MTISQASWTFRVLGSMSRSLWLVLEKTKNKTKQKNKQNKQTNKQKKNKKKKNKQTKKQNKTKNHTNVGYDNISSKLHFQGPGLKLKVIVAIFRKALSSLWRLHLLMDWIKPYECWL